jgi:hypothetical protein
MRQHRSKNALTLQFGQHDYLQTIIEDQPINIRVLPSLKLSLLARCPSRNEEGDTKEKTSEVVANNDLEEPSESKLTSGVNHGKKNLYL